MSTNLEKGQKFFLTKNSGDAPITKVIIGLGWDPVTRGESLEDWFSSGGKIDLDASCVMINENRKIADTVSCRQLLSKDGSVTHTGDNETGEGSGDDEQIIVDLNNIPAHINTLVFTVNSFTGHDFSFITNAFCRVTNAADNQEIVRYTLNAQGPYTALIMAKLYRQDNQWILQAIGKGDDARSVEALSGKIAQYS